MKQENFKILPDFDIFISNNQYLLFVDPVLSRAKMKLIESIGRYLPYDPNKKKLLKVSSPSRRNV